MTNDVRIGARGEHVIEIVLTRPDAGNALSPAMANAIVGAIDTMPADTRAVFLRAEGVDFCTGRTPVMPKPGTRATALDLRRLIADPVIDFYQRLRDLPVPLVMAVQGRAFGVGCALAGLADVCIAAETATFCVPEMDKDIAPTLVMTALSDRLARADLARLVLSRVPISASEAKTTGLVGSVCREDRLLDEADSLLGRLRENSVPVLSAVKTFLNQHAEMSFAARREVAALMNCVVTAERYR
jgi:enoyl-CoA hydratase/carnithine racemase